MRRYQNPSCTATAAAAGESPPRGVRSSRGERRVGFKAIIALFSLHARAGPRRTGRAHTLAHMEPAGSPAGPGPETAPPPTVEARRDDDTNVTSGRANADAAPAAPRPAPSPPPPPHPLPHSRADRLAHTVQEQVREGGRRRAGGPDALSLFSVSLSLSQPLTPSHLNTDRPGRRPRGRRLRGRPRPRHRRRRPGPPRQRRPGRPLRRPRRRPGGVAGPGGGGRGQAGVPGGGGPGRRVRPGGAYGGVGAGGGGPGCAQSSAAGGGRAGGGGGGGRRRRRWGRRPGGPCWGGRPPAVTGRQETAESRECVC